jgi:hypothetical protein
MCQSARKVLDGAMPSFSASNHPPTFARALVYTVAVCRVVLIVAYTFLWSLQTLSLVMIP